MAGHACRARQVVVAVHVALPALHAHMSARERERRLGMVEGCRHPRRGRMANITGLRHARRRMIRIRG